jgi:glycerol-3-phosphate acyltransferase PlsY
MLSYLLAILFVALAYLIGAIPVAYLVVYAVKRVDIRTVGSGNVGATNAGRYLGFRYFLLVFLLDLAKGLIPTLSFPVLLAEATGQHLHGLDVFVALATILGHNYPVYLKFRGGKGVATSLGALCALDTAASAGSFASFVVFLVITRYVSLSSLGGGLVFLVLHFLGVKEPWSRGEIVMSVATIGLLGMLFVRHRKNLARVVAGTEPKVSFRKPKPPPAAACAFLLVLVLLGAGTGVAYYSSRPAVLDCGDFELRAAGQLRTGHQRADRLAFADAGKLLAVTCPRYNRVVLYRVEPGPSLKLVRDVSLEGRPVDVRSSRDSFFVLARPSNDARHLEPAWWQRIDFEGNPQGTKVRVGYDPDDMAIGDDDRVACVLLSGNAEGETNRPSPSLRVFDLRDPATPRLRGEVFFDQPGDDPYRLACDPSFQRAAVSLRGTRTIAWIDLSDRDRPRLVRRSTLPGFATPGSLVFLGADKLLVADDDCGTAWSLGFESDRSCRVPFQSTVRDIAVVTRPAEDKQALRQFYIATDPRCSALEVFEQGTAQSLGELALRSSGKLGRILPVSLAHAQDVVAVADRSGGVHVIELRRKDRPGHRSER